jgi:hypothetical protein
VENTIFTQQEKSKFNLCSFFFQQKVFVIWFRWDQLGIRICPQQEEFFFITKKYFQRLKTMDSILWVSLGHIKPFLGIFCKFFHI